MLLLFLSTPLAVAWVFRLTFSPLSPSLSLFSDFQLCSYPAEKSSSFVPTRPRKAQVFVSVRYIKHCGGAVYAILFVKQPININLSAKYCTLGY